MPSKRAKRRFHRKRERKDRAFSFRGDRLMREKADREAHRERHRPAKDQP